jgi:hypothetical protein
MSGEESDHECKIECEDLASQGRIYVARPSSQTLRQRILLAQQKHPKFEENGKRKDAESQKHCEFSKSWITKPRLAPQLPKGCRVCDPTRWRQHSTANARCAEVPGMEGELATVPNTERALDKGGPQGGSRLRRHGYDWGGPMARWPSTTWQPCQLTLVLGSSGGESHLIFTFFLYSNWSQFFYKGKIGAKFRK